MRLGRGNDHRAKRGAGQMARGKMSRKNRSSSENFFHSAGPTAVSLAAVDSPCCPSSLTRQSPASSTRVVSVRLKRVFLRSMVFRLNTLLTFCVVYLLPPLQLCLEVSSICLVFSSFACLRLLFSLPGLSLSSFFFSPIAGSVPFSLWMLLFFTTWYPLLLSSFFRRTLPSRVLRCFFLVHRLTRLSAVAFHSVFSFRPSGSRLDD